MVNWEVGKEAINVEQQMALEGRSINSGKISTGGHSGLLDVHSMDPKRHSREALINMIHFPMEGAERISF